MSQVGASSLTPIADLSYRNYDGPLASPRLRWWVIAKQMILKAFGMKSLWVFAALSGWYFIVMVIILFVFQTFANLSPTGAAGFQQYIDGIAWKDQFFHGFSYAQHLLLVVALLLGAGAIANDNRANALLVYLSKPCTKLDYLIGKWVGVFVPILAVITLPILVFYGYGAFSFKDQGFISKDPLLLLRMLSVLPLSAALHTSLILAVSSLFKQGRLAGATYAAIYFLSNFFTLLMEFLWFSSEGKAPLVGTLFYASVDGIQIGLAKAILRPSGTLQFGAPQTGTVPEIPSPPLVPDLLFVALLCAACFGLAWSRIRAVEVV